MKGIKSFLFLKFLLSSAKIFGDFLFLNIVSTLVRTIV